MDPPIEVAFCFDDHLALPGAVTILSLLGSRRADIRLHILTNPAPIAAALLRAIAEQHGISLRIVDTAPDGTHGLDPASPYGLPSTATYRRIFLAELLPDLERVLYLDADLLVRHDLSALWGMAMGEASLAAAEDPWMATVPGLVGDYPGGYFNAGVLLMDLERWRRQDLTAHCVEELGRQQEAAARAGRNALSYSNDQSALNAMVRGRWSRISPRWNFTTLHTPRVGKALGVAPQDFAAMTADPAIVHFLGAYKPWLPGCARLTRWHQSYHRLRLSLEEDFVPGGLRWPGPYTHGAETVRRRRLIAMRLVHRAKEARFGCPMIVLTGLLGRDLLIVAREQGLAISGFASESPACAGGELDGVAIHSIAQAIAEGQRDFILADHRRVAWTRAAVEEEAARRGADVRIVDAESEGLL